MRILFFLLAAVTASAEDVSEYNIPEQLSRCMATTGGAYRLSSRINPFYLRGDLDGDGRIDYAALVESATAQKGILICRSSAASPIILGAGAHFHRMDDLTFGAWVVQPKGKVERGAGETRPPILKGDALLLIWPESASGLVYWDGQRFRWYQQGD